ncbi:MAG: twitching motility protein PilT [Lachnospiraceae bacterium]|nr:twitching motility protein PilT [Lachnospiraceae bacterium]MBP5600406.1 twitching motility protein PilT [Lachnospiraceae bacterium]
MVQLIVGEKGKGKTKHLLDKVNTEIKNVSGNIVYLDKSAKNMYELNNKVRLIDVSDYFIENFSEFLGFVCGIISQDHDLEQMYLDSFFPISKAEKDDMDACIDKLEKVGDKFGVDFVVAVSLTESELSDKAKSKVIISL